MAASSGAGASCRGGCRRRVGRGKRGGGRGPGGGGPGPLKRLKLAVEEFVQATSEDRHPGRREGPRAEQRARLGGRKSRRELRKEKRQLRKARRLRRTAGSAQDPGGGTRAGSGASAEGAEGRGGRAPRPPQAPPPPRAPARAAPGSTRPSAAANAARKRALLAANEEEDREIRKLERRLGLNKRRRKGGASSVPLSFARDGLDYILGALGSDRSGLCDGSSEAEAGGPKALESDVDSEAEDAGHADSEAEDNGHADSEAEDNNHADSEAEDNSHADSEAEDNSHADSDWEPDDGEPEAGAGAQSEREQQEDAREEKRGEGPAAGRAKGKPGGKRVRFAEDEERSESPPEDVDAADQIALTSCNNDPKWKRHDVGDLDLPKSHQVLPLNGKSLCENGEKYIPPHLRRAEETVDARKREERERLKKHVQGLINRLSELNMASISGQLEELYMAHSRKDMNDTLTGVLMSACATGTAMPDRLVMEHVLLVSILHRMVGIEVGAHFLEAVVKRFDDVYKKGSEDKECGNLFTIIAHLYNFHVVESLLIFDILKKLIGTFMEKDIELILLMLRNVGFSLRKDDALSLKELIAEAQARASAAGAKFQDQARIRFMLETMLALKNNDMRKIPGYDPEPVEKLKKLQRALVRSASSGTESQLRVSWDGVLKAEQTGRWWIVGSAWTGAPMIDSSQQKAPQKPLVDTVSVKMLELARKQRMNTDVRRNIFCTIMTSEDFLDAFEKLLKLGLKDQQEREIVHVLMDCCLQEKTYNPFYAFLAGKFCNYERRFQMTFQFSIWDKFRDLENLPATNFSNLIHLVAHLLKAKSLPLSILKVIEFSELDKPRVHFLRKVLYMLLMETEVEDLGLIFARVSSNPKLGVLREGLKLFISHFLLKSAQAHRSADEAGALRARAELTTKALQGKPLLGL